MSRLILAAIVFAFCLLYIYILFVSLFIFFVSLLSWSLKLEHLTYLFEEDDLKCNHCKGKNTNDI